MLPQIQTFKSFLLSHFSFRSDSTHNCAKEGVLQRDMDESSTQFIRHPPLYLFHVFIRTKILGIYYSLHKLQQKKTKEEDIEPTFLYHQ